MEQQKLCLSNHDFIKENIYISRFEGLTLTEYVHARSVVCSRNHKKPCKVCEGMIRVANEIIEKGVMKLSDAFKLCSPHVKYKSVQARRKLLQMPLSVVAIGSFKEGTLCLYLLKKFKPANWSIIQAIMSKVNTSKKYPIELSKTEVKKLLDLAESESERERLKYAVVKSSGISNSKAKTVYGFCDMGDKKSKVEQAMEEACAIKNAIENIANIKDKVLLQSFGIYETSESEKSDSETDSDTDTDNTDFAKDQPCTSSKLPTIKETADSVPNSLGFQDLCDVLRKCDLNWFYFIREVNHTAHLIPKDLEKLFDFSKQFASLGFSEQEINIIEQSRQAFISIDRQKEEQIDSDEARNIDTDTSESASSEAEIWAKGIQSPMDEQGKLLILKRRASIRRKCVREVKKRLAESRFLKRRRSKKVRKIISECPGIGKEIEDFV